MTKTLKTAARIAAGSALAFSALAVASMPAQAAIVPDTTTVSSDPASNNQVAFAPLIDGGLVNGPLVDGPLVNTGGTGPFQFGQFQ
ncbi:MAG TPA: hypothetical protein VLS95_16740 [Arthrobacter sp.]|nr:hypothetical protein [Arthrobacter sp.]